MDLKHRQRFFLSVFFFLSGVCFSTWASRIPTIKSTFGYNDAELGTLLLFMPITSLIGLPISGWLIARYDSRVPLTGAFLLLAVSLSLIGFSTGSAALIASISLFSLSLRMINISVNTQAITLQKKFEKKINGSFHGLWSTGGIAGVGFSTVMVAFKISMAVHLLIVAAITFVATLYCFRFLLHGDRAPSGNTIKIGKPDLSIVYLGLLLFFACVCEGGMFDWSGIYFKEIVQVEIFTWGYLTFMICMAASRFASDWMMEEFGMRTLYVISALLIFCGIGLAVLWPGFWPSLAGFCLAGFGTASVIPMTYLLAGSSKKYSAGIVISIIATYGIVGMLAGPPLIGYIAHAFNLKIAFLVFALSGILLIPISQRYFRYQESRE